MARRSKPNGPAPRVNRKHAVVGRTHARTATRAGRPLRFNPLRAGQWIRHQVELERVDDSSLRQVLTEICESIFTEDVLVRLPARALLVYPRFATGRKVIQSIDETNPVRDFILAGDHPAEDAELQKLCSLEAGDARQPDRNVPSHPAVVAFTLAGGALPHAGTGEGWPLRHTYDGRFPFEGNCNSFKASDYSFHHTQTAGLVCVHPIIDRLWKRYGAMAKTLRARTWKAFGYDPECYFSDRPRNGLRPGFVRFSTE